jgi:membrane peptidoglycan carboxypeptidase
MDARRKVILAKRGLARRNSHRPNFFVWLLRAAAALVLVVLLLNVGVVLAAVGTVYGVYSYYAKDLPDPRAIETEQQNFETTKIYDRTGKVLLYEVFDPRLGDRQYVTFEQVPKYCIDATVASEDKRFWENPGFDLQGMGRAFWEDLTGGTFQGASSITQQLVKNIIIDPEERTQRSYARKIKEVILSAEITRRYEKKQILEWYLNTNHYGNLAYGIQAAAQVYFQKSTSPTRLRRVKRRSWIRWSVTGTSPRPRPTLLLPSNWSSSRCRNGSTSSPRISPFTSASSLKTCSALTWFIGVG